MGHRDIEFVESIPLAGIDENPESGRDRQQ